MSTNGTASGGWERLPVRPAVAVAGGAPGAPPLVPRAGVDLVQVSEVRRALASFGERYLRRLFTPGEVDDCRRAADPVPHLAARLAAKEATIKVLGVDDLQPPWTAIEVCRRASGAPELSLTGEAARLAEAQRLAGLSLSLSHEGDLAIAFVIAMPGAS